MKNYKVEVTYTMVYSKTFSVEASNREEARAKAEEMAMNFDMTNGSHDGGEIDSTVLDPLLSE